MIDESSLVTKAIGYVLKANYSYCKFLSANDSGETGGHQSGILISINARSMFFDDKELKNNHILKRQGKIYWQSDYETNCTVTWYASKRELRLTGFGRGLSPLCAEYTGALFILIKKEEADYYYGFILNQDSSINEFLDIFGLTPAETNRLIELSRLKTNIKEEQAIDSFISKLDVDFPTSSVMSLAARNIYDEVFQNYKYPVVDSDALLLSWTDMEYRLFRTMERVRYGDKIVKGFSSVDDFIILANKVLNRRKSRAGKSLEHHLAALFDLREIKYSAQAKTEGNKKPDFIFPSAEAYHDYSYPINKMCLLAAKTTCKDRWRQILNEGDRFRNENKFLCTMQQGISSSQMDEMNAERVILVVPKPYISAYPKDKRDRIWTINNFVDYIKEMEGLS